MILGKSVHHARFGVGIVEAVDGKYMTVTFKGESRRFLYPDAFDGYLTVDDKDAVDEIGQALALAKREKAIEAARRICETSCLSKRGSVVEGHRREWSPTPEDESEIDSL